MLFYSYAELVVGLIAVFLLYFKNFCNYKIQAVLYSVTARCYHYGKHFYVHRRRTKKWGFTVSALCGIDIYACNIRIQ